MNAAELTIGQPVLVRYNSRTLPARVKRLGPESYEVTVTVANQHGSTELVMHQDNVERDLKDAAAMLEP